MDFSPSSGGSRQQPAGLTCVPAFSCSGPWQPPGPRWGWTPTAAALCPLQGLCIQSLSEEPGRGRSGYSGRIGLGETPPSSEPEKEKRENCCLVRWYCLIQELIPQQEYEPLPEFICRLINWSTEWSVLHSSMLGGNILREIQYLTKIKTKRLRQRIWGLSVLIL